MILSISPNKELDRDFVPKNLCAKLGSNKSERLVAIVLTHTHKRKRTFFVILKYEDITRSSNKVL